MAEDQVDEVEAETVERGVDGLQEVLAVQGVLHVGPVVDPPEELARDDELVALPTEGLNGLAHDDLRLAAGVGLGIVEEVHSRLAGGLEAAHGEVVVHLGAEADPGAERQQSSP